MKRDVLVVYFASRDKKMPRWLSVLAVVTAAYAFSPIDLIPDFIPVLGLLDDLVLIPLCIAIILRVTPAAVLERARMKVDLEPPRFSARVAALMVILIWIVCAVILLVTFALLVE